MGFGPSKAERDALAAQAGSARDDKLAFFFGVYSESH